MGPDLISYIGVAAVAAGVTVLVTPLARAVARQRGWVVQPNVRSVHSHPTAQSGGFAMLVGILVALAAASWSGRFDGVLSNTTEPVGIVLAMLIVFATGWFDDLYDLPPPAKVTGIVVAGLVLWWFGASMFYFRVPFMDVFILSDDWAPLVTVIWLLGITQAVNLIDGLDGLAAGIVGIASIAFFIYSVALHDVGLLSDRNIGPLLAAITAGTCVGFLPHNFSPARIFMGDSGAFLLGTMMAVSTSVVGGRADPATDSFVGQTFFFFAPLAIPLVILGVPIIDTLFAVVRRATSRQAIDVVDKGHLHHRLMNLGHGHRRSVLILWAWTALLSGFVLYPVLSGSNPSWLLLGMGAISISLYTLMHPSVRLKRALEVEEALSRPAREQLDPDRPETLGIPARFPRLRRRLRSWRGNTQDEREDTTGGGLEEAVSGNMGLDDGTDTGSQ